MSDLHNTFTEIGRRLEDEEERMLHKAAISECVMALSVNDDGVIGYATPPLARQFGWLPDELNGKPLETLLPPKARAAHTGQHVVGYFKNPVSRQMGAGDGTPESDRTILTGWNERKQQEFLVVIGLEPQHYLGRNWVIATLALPLKEPTG